MPKLKRSIERLLVSFVLWTLTLRTACGVIKGRSSSNWACTTALSVPIKIIFFGVIPVAPTTFKGAVIDGWRSGSRGYGRGREGGWYSWTVEAMGNIRYRTIPTAALSIASCLAYSWVTTVTASLRVDTRARARMIEAEGHIWHAGIKATTTCSDTRGLRDTLVPTVDSLIRFDRGTQPNTISFSKCNVINSNITSVAFSTNAFNDNPVWSLRDYCSFTTLPYISLGTI